MASGRLHVATSRNHVVLDLQLGLATVDLVIVHYVALVENKLASMPCAFDPATVAASASLAFFLGLLCFVCLIEKNFTDQRSGAE